MSDYSAVLAYIDDYWQRIIRSNPEERGTLIGLPHPYLVPSDSGGDTHMMQEFYYWDSFFISLGVIGTEHQYLVEATARNMGYLIERFGIIPNGSRYYFLSRSQPPFFMAQIKLAYRLSHDAKLLTDLLPLAIREHEEVWHGTAQPHHRLVYRGLSRYFDINYLQILASCECGWDHSTRCDDRWLDHLPVDLNSILYEREIDFAWANETLGHVEIAESWRARAAARAATMNELMWDKAQGFFFDYDYTREQRNPDPSLAGFFPLWAGWASEEQAAHAVRDWLPRFEMNGGLVTTLKQETGKQWAYPNGWAPLQWIVVEGLQRYGYAEDADRLRRKWCDTVAHVFHAHEPHICREKYNVVDRDDAGEGGLYGHLPGFGWTNAVFKVFAHELMAEEA